MGSYRVGGMSVAVIKVLSELLYTAYSSFTTIEASLSYYVDCRVMDLAFAKWAKGKTSGSVASFAGKTSRTNNMELCYQWNVWFAKPSFWRYENKRLNKKPSVSVINGNSWWYYADDQLYTNVLPSQGVYVTKEVPLSDNFTRIEHAIQDMPFLDPSFLLSSHILSVQSGTIYAGREALRVRGVPRRGREPAWDPMFWGAADEYDFLVDKEKGILLRYSAKLGEQEYAIATVDKILFDQSIPMELFCFIPESNMEICFIKQEAN